MTNLVDLFTLWNNSSEVQTEFNSVGKYVDAVQKSTI